MTSYRTADKYDDEVVIGTITRVFSDSFLLKSDKMYYCVSSLPINQGAHYLVGKQVKCEGRVEIYCGNLARIDKHVYEFIVRTLSPYEG